MNTFYNSNKKICLFLLMLLFALLFLNLSLAFAETNDDKNLLVAEQALKQGKFKEVEIHLKNAIKDNPENPQIHLKMAEYYIRVGQGDLADIELEKAINNGAKKEQLIILQMKNHLIQGRFSEITKQNTPLLNLPTSEIARIRALQGQAYINQNKLEKAKNLFSRASRLSPDQLEVRIALARLYMLEQQNDKAEQLVEVLHKQYPYEADVLILAGNLYRDKQQFMEAYTAFESASEIQPGNIAGWLGMVTSLVGQSKYEEADIKIQSILEVNPEHELANYLQALIAYKLNNQAKARQAINILLKENPDHKGVLWIAGALDYRKRRYDDARPKLEAYLEHNPGHFQSAKMLAAIYLSADKERDAIELLKPFSKQWDNVAYSILGDAYKQLGDLDKSYQYYTQAKALSPDDKSLQSKVLMNKLGRGENISSELVDSDFENLQGVGFARITSLLMNNQLDKTIEVIDHYQQKNLNNASLFFLLGKAYFQKKEIDKAEINFKKSLELSEKFIPAYLSMAEIHLIRNKIELARREYKRALAIEPKHETTLLNMAKLSQIEKDYPKMLDWLNKARENNEASINARLLLNDYYLATRNYAQAEKMTQELVIQYPDNIKLLKLHADNLFAAKKLTAAIIVYKHIITIKPESAIAYYWLGSTEYIWQDYTNAKIHLQKSLQLDADNFLAKVTIIKIDLKNKQLESAQQQLSELLIQYPQHDLSHETQGDLLIAQGKPGQAVKHYQHALKIKSENPMLINKMAKLQAIMGNYIESTRIIESWLSSHPKDIQSRMNLALLYQKTGKIKFAQRHYEFILSKQPKNISVINNLALIYDELDDPRSFEFAEVAYSLAPEDVNIIDTLGWMLVNHNEQQRGMELLKKAANLDPSNLEVVYHYAVALAATENQTQAMAKLNMIIPMPGRFEGREAAKILLEKLQKEKQNQ